MYFTNLNYAKADIPNPHDLNLLDIEDIGEYGKKISQIMGVCYMTFPVLTIIDECDYSDIGKSYSNKSHMYKAEWRYARCRYVNGFPATMIGDGLARGNEIVIGFLTMDTPWEDIKKIFNELGIYPGWSGYCD